MDCLAAKYAPRADGLFGGDFRRWGNETANEVGGIAIELGSVIVLAPSSYLIALYLLLQSEA